MIYNFKYQPHFCHTTGARNEVLEYLETNKFKRVLDIGSSISSWASKYLTHYADLHDINSFKDYPNKNLIGFVGNICSFSIWEKILDDVEKNGKFDFAICSHTLEDICNPALVCEMLPRVAKEGYIAVPSKFHEFKKHESNWLGWMHHRWIFNKEGNEFVGYPKVNCLEYFDWSFVFNQSEFHDTMDLSFFWKDTFQLKLANNDFLGPNVQEALKVFNGLGNK